MGQTTLQGISPRRSKPRPAMILQDERFDATDSLTICGITTTYADSPLFRAPVIPNSQNGLRVAGYIIAG
jgi:mRNA interferase MazF